MIRKLKLTDNMNRTASLIYKTDSVFSFLFGKEKKAIPKIVKLIQLENNSFSYQHIFAYFDQEELKGILIGYLPDKIDKKQEWNDFKQVFSFLELIFLFFKLLLIKPLEDKKGVDSFYLQNVCILNSERNKGIGSKLIEYFCSYIQSKQKNSVYLDVAFDNKSAKRLYENIGFKVIDKKKIKLLSSGIIRMKKIFGNSNKFWN